MNTAIKQLTDEAHEILMNIRSAAQAGDITWAQRDELVSLVMTDVHMKIKLAGNLLHDWTGTRPSDYPVPDGEELRP